MKEGEDRMKTTMNDIAQDILKWAENFPAVLEDSPEDAGEWVETLTDLAFELWQLQHEEGGE